MIELLPQALRLSELGLALHWICPPRAERCPVHKDVERPCAQGKTPIRLSWQQMPYCSPDKLRRWYRPGYNVGLRTGFVPGASRHLVVLDIDSPEAMAYVLSQHLPDTPCKALSCRGEHWYYGHPGEGVHIGNRTKIDGYAVDLRGDGGQVVCPPSVHPSGHVYRWKRLDDGPLPIWSPSWFPRKPAPPAAPTMVDSSSKRALRRGIARALKWPTAEENEGRGTQTFLLAKILVRELGLDGEMAYRVLAEYWNRRLAQPYSEQLLRRKISEAQGARRASAPSDVQRGSAWH